MSKNLGIVKRPQLLDFHSGFGGLCAETDEIRGIIILALIKKLKGLSQ